MSLRLSLAAAAALAVAACASAPTTFYTLDPAAPAAPEPTRAILPVRIDAVHIPPTLNRPQIVQEASGNRVVLHDFAEWSAPLGAQMRRVLTHDLAVRLPLGSVIYPDAPKPPLGRGIVVDVLAISRDGESATMDVSWTMTVTAPPPPGSAPASLTYIGRTLRVTAPSAGSDVAAVPIDLSALIARLADSVAADLVLSAPK